MSQIGFFSYLRKSDVPFLGFWSKPKPRLFRKSESKFEEFIQKHALRRSVFNRADGVYVALVFAWIEINDKSFSREADPVLETVRKRISGSHWLVKFEDVRIVSLIEKSTAESEWPSILGKLSITDEESFDWNSFEDARRFVRDMILELQIAEALFVSVG